MLPFDQPFDQAPSGFTVNQGLFPENRPSVPMQGQVNDMVPPKEELKPINKSHLVDQEIIGMVMTRMNVSREWRRPWRLLWDKAWQHMKGQYDTAGKAAWQSRTFMPLTSKVVEVIVSNLHSGVFGPEMPVEYQTKRSDLDQLIRSHNEVIQTDFDKCGAKAQFTDFLRNMCVMGTAVGEVGYVKSTETVMIKQKNSLPPQMAEMIQQMGIKPQEQFVPKQMLVKDYATITNVDAYDIYPEPRTQDFSKDHWVIHHSKISNRDLKIGSMDVDPYYKLDNVTDDVLEGSGQARVDEDPEKQTRRYALMDYSAYTHFLDPDRMHDLYTFYGQIPVWYLDSTAINDKKRQYDSVPGCIKVVDGQWVVWKRISPWRDGEPPYFKGNYIRIPTEFYGIGVAELVMGLQIEKNEIRNSRMDNINLAQNKIIAVLKDLIPPGEHKRLKSEPGALWLIKGVDDVRKAIQQVEMGNVTQDTWIASKEVDQEAQEVTAASKVTQAAGGGEDESGGGTFRGQMLNVQQATGRWMLYARMFEWTGLIPAMKKFYQRIYQFKDLKDAQETLGGQRGKAFEFIAPEDLDKVAKLVPLGVMTMENKGVKLAQMAQFAQEMSQLAGPLPPWFKALEFARKQAVEMGNQEPDQILFSDEEMQQYNMMKKMAAQEEMGMASHLSGLGIPPSGSQNVPRGTNQSPQTGQGANVPGGQPVAGQTVGPAQGMPRPAMPARGPGASRMDVTGRPNG